MGVKAKGFSGFAVVNEKRDLSRQHCYFITAPNADITSFAKTGKKHLGESYSP